MDVLLARILKYLNGALVYDDAYKFCTYIVDHYLEMESMTKERILAETGIDENNMDNFIGRLGCDFDWQTFHRIFVQHHLTRLDQIRGRMVGLRAADLVKNMKKDMSDQEMLDYVSVICEQIDSHKRIFIIGALYPMSIAVEFQTDLITFGKNVVQYHNYDPTITFTGDDMLVFISATGRAMNGFLQAKGSLNPEAATSLLITQNPVYTRQEHKISNYVLRLPGRYDGLDFNYQLMQIFDLLRIQYYQKYYLGM
jgi:DNA-binding MurR/RpiR family transcriptional regulator